MKTVVITGSTRGIGFGLAEAFLARGCRVVVSGRTASAVAEAVRQLSALRPGMVVTDLLVGQYADRPDEWERARGISGEPNGK